MKTNLISFPIVYIVLLAACGNQHDTATNVAVIVALTQTASALTHAPVTATETSTSGAPVGHYQPISEVECSDLNAILSQQAGIPGTITNHVAFVDKTGYTGFACSISIGMNRNLGSLDAASALTNNGWIEDEAYAAPGLFGSETGFRKQNKLCLWSTHLELTGCGQNESYIDCQMRLPLEQQRIQHDLYCAEYVP